MSFSNNNGCNDNFQYIMQYQNISIIQNTLMYASPGIACYIHRNHYLFSHKCYKLVRTFVFTITDIITLTVFSFNQLQTELVIS